MEAQKFNRQFVLKRSIPKCRLERLFCQKIIHIDEGSYSNLARIILRVARFKRYGLIQMMSTYFFISMKCRVLQSDMIRFFQAKTPFIQFTGPPYFSPKPFLCKQQCLA